MGKNKNNGGTATMIGTGLRDRETDQELDEQACIKRLQEITAQAEVVAEQTQTVKAARATEKEAKEEREKQESELRECQTVLSDIVKGQVRMF